jgi:hypothetical protein
MPAKKVAEIIRAGRLRPSLIPLGDSAKPPSNFVFMTNRKDSKPAAIPAFAALAGLRLPQNRSREDRATTREKS